jgi:hypothetical protein
MATIKQKRAVQNMVEKGGNVSKAMRDTGYSPATAENPSKLAGLKLIGFSVWERRGNGGRNVTFPARQYSVNGERR